MDIENKKDLVLKYIKLGIEIQKAFLLSECTDNDIELLQNDNRFKIAVDTHIALEESRLLEMHNKALTIAAEKGNTNGLQWKLSKINPDKWGTNNISKDVDTSSETVKTVVYLPENNR